MLQREPAKVTVSFASVALAHAVIVSSGVFKLNGSRVFIWCHFIFLSICARMTYCWPNLLIRLLSFKDWGALSYFETPGMLTQSLRRIDQKSSMRPVIWPRRLILDHLTFGMIRPFYMRAYDFFKMPSLTDWVRGWLSHRSTRLGEALVAHVID
jgi:hypothetical protein